MGIFVRLGRHTDYFTYSGQDKHTYIYICKTSTFTSIIHLKKQSVRMNIHPLQEKPKHFNTQRSNNPNFSNRDPVRHSFGSHGTCPSR